MSFALGLVKRIANLALEQTGHRIERTRSIPSFDRLVLHLKQAGLAPSTIFDIGIAKGTPWLYKAYPDAKYYLFDPTPESLPHMNQISKTLDAKVFNIALGATESTVKIKVRPEHSGSTLFQEVGDADISRVVEVPMRRFDSEILNIQKPAMAKVDVQGAEMMVLKGMGDRIKEIDCFIIETSLISTLHDSPEFAEVNAFMALNGFVLYDIINLSRRPLDNALAQIDAVYVSVGSQLRLDRRWGN